MVEKIVIELNDPIVKKWYSQDAGRAVKVSHMFAEITMNAAEASSFRIGPRFGFYPETATVDDLINAFGSKEKMFAAIDAKKAEQEAVLAELREKLAAFNSVLGAKRAAERAIIEAEHEERRQNIARAGGKSRFSGMGIPCGD